MKTKIRRRLVVSSTRRNRRRLGKRVSRRRQKLNGGFLGALVPIIAAAIGAIPGIASAAIAGQQLKKH